MSETGVTVREALDAMVSAGRFLEWPRLDAQRALDMVLPYAECEVFTNASPAQNYGVRGIVCAVVGDCYQSLKDFERAAGWYLRARGYMRAGGGAPFFAPFYATAVIDGRLMGHATLAAECLRDHRAAWRAKPLLTRLYWEVVSLWWLKPSQWRMRLRELRLLGQLEALARER